MTTIHLISHTHWDREWYLPFQQFRLKLVHLVDHLLEILETEPEYHYFLLDGQAIILEDYLYLRPERRSDLQRFIQNGRIQVGPWYVSPDEFLLSPESHVRNLLEGHRICTSFGARMPVGYLPDTFGHIGQMPQILLGFGIDSACLWRGLDGQPSELLWESPDGSRLLLAYLRHSYSNAANLSPSDPDHFINGILEETRTLAPFTATGQVLLMHGTDHMEPSRHLPRAMQAYRQKYPQDSLLHSTLPDYFESVRSQASLDQLSLPVVTGELRSSRRSPLLPGVLSTHMELKQRNHASEIGLLKWVEPFYLWTRLLPDLKPGANPDNQENFFLADQRGILRDAWKLLMQCHPHDSICGTSIDPVVAEMQVRFSQVDQVSSSLTVQNLQNICDHIDTTFPALKGQPARSQDILSSIVIFNPNDQPQSGLVRLNARLDDQHSSFQVVDEHAEPVPFHQAGQGSAELVAMTMDRNGLKQALGMIHEGNVAGMVIRDFNIRTEAGQAFIQVSISDHGLVDLARWKQGLAMLDLAIADEKIKEFIVRAYSDPEVESSFVARDVPGHGFRCYWVRGIEVSSPARTRKLNPLVQAFLPAIRLLGRVPILPRVTSLGKPASSNRPPQVENEFFVVDVTGLDGTFSITDKRTHQVYSDMHRFVDGADRGDLYNYCPPEHDRLAHARLVGIQRRETEVSRELLIHSRIFLPQGLSQDRNSRHRRLLRHDIYTTVTLVPGVPRVDIHTELDNQVRDHRLRVHFPAPFATTSAFYDGHFELVERPLGVPPYDETWVEHPRPEQPQRQFTLVRNDQLSLAVANRGLPEVEVFKNAAGNVELALTLLRCVGWLSRDDMTTRKGHAGPMGIATPSAQMPGRQSFEYSIIPGTADILPAIHQSLAFNAPLKAVTTSLHPGLTINPPSLIENSNPNFLITAIKEPQAGSGMLVRGYNLLASPLEVSLKPYIVFAHAQLVNLLEEPLADLPVMKDGQTSLQVGAHKIISILFTA